MVVVIGFVLAVTLLSAVKVFVEIQLLEELSQAITEPIEALKVIVAEEFKHCKVVVLIDPGMVIASQLTKTMLLLTSE